MALKRDFLTPRQVCEIYQCTPEQVQTMLRSGVLKGIKNPGKGHIWRIYDPGPTLHVPDCKSDDWYILRECEIAKIVGITPRMIRHLVDEGKLAPKRLSPKKYRNGKTRYSVADIRTLIAHRLDPSLKGAARREEIMRWAIEKIIKKPLDVDLRRVVEGDFDSTP